MKHCLSTTDRTNLKILFQEFLDGLAILTKWSEECKLQWIFKLYDIDRDGILSNEVRLCTKKTFKFLKRKICAKNDKVSKHKFSSFINLCAAVCFPGAIGCVELNV